MKSVNTIELSYGTLHVAVGGFDGNYRRDLYVSKADGKSYPEGIFADCQSDFSAPHNKSMGGEYDARCSCCYLNFSHTEQAHQRRKGICHYIP